MRFHCLQHVPFETPGSIETWINDRQYSLSFTHLYDDEPLPLLDEIDALIILGGPMSVHDEADFLWLKKEKTFIAAAIRQEKKLLGICLGAQLIAEQMGATVYANPQKEIGFMPVCFTAAAQSSALTRFPVQATVFHWHGETFELPVNAVHLAYTEICANQAFLFGSNILGIQFHLEVTPRIVAEMLSHEKHELVTAPFIHPEEKIKQDIYHLDANQEMLFSLLNHFFG